MRFKSAIVLILALAGAGCSGGDPPKNGVKVQPGDYDHAPGGGNKPSTPASGANGNG